MASCAGAASSSSESESWCRLCERRGRERLGESLDEDWRLNEVGFLDWPFGFDLEESERENDFGGGLPSAGVWDEDMTVVLFTRGYSLGDDTIENCSFEYV